MPRFACNDRRSPSEELAPNIPGGKRSAERSPFVRQMVCWRGKDRKRFISKHSCRVRRSTLIYLELTLRDFASCLCKSRKG